MSKSATLGAVLTDWAPFGPHMSEDLVDAGLVDSEQLFDRSNLIYSQRGERPPTYIIGRKGAGKTAFLLGRPRSSGAAREILTTDAVYSEIAAVLHHYRTARGPLFVPQTAEVWRALFEHVAAFHVCNTARSEDPPAELQIVWDYLAAPPHCASTATAMAQRFLTELHRRVDDHSVRGLHELIAGMTRDGIPFREVREALLAVVKARGERAAIVMDNLEDLHTRLPELEEVLGGLFHVAGLVANRTTERAPFELQICLPSEIWQQIHRVSAAPEKDFGGNYLTIYWTARELLHLVASRYRLYLENHHPDRLGVLARGADGDVAVLRAALPPTVTNGLGGKEDTIAYILRHTQLLPRHLISILNCVFTEPLSGSAPWAVTEDAVKIGTRLGEEIIVNGIVTAHHSAFPFAEAALQKIANRLSICFPARELRRVFRWEGIEKATGADFDAFLEMLVTLGAIGVKVDRTARYNVAQFQYTFNSRLNPQEDTDDLCFHPLFVRRLLDRSLDRLRQAGELATYPFGCDIADGDYRLALGYAPQRTGRSS